MKTLAVLGFGVYQSERAGELFRRYDEKLLGEMASLWSGDFAAYQKVVRDRTAMFEDLMRTDMTAMRNANDDEALAIEAEAAAEAGQGGA